MTLRERIARAIVGEFPPRSHADNDDFAEALIYADAALAALGLDDPDAAVERAAQRLIRMYSFFEPSDNDYAWRAARAVLEAALTPLEAQP